MDLTEAMFAHKEYTSDLTDAEWTKIEPLLLPEKLLDGDGK